MISSMSRFNTDTLCLQCHSDEKTAPGYQKAHDAEVAATRLGRLNFPGIGLGEEDSRYLRMVLEFRRAFRFRVGTPVVLAEDFERYPLGAFPKGSTGKIVTVRPDLIAVKLDVFHPALQEWRNELQWYPNNEDEDHINSFFQYVVPVPSEVL
jgi:hypothetical protein